MSNFSCSGACHEGMLLSGGVQVFCGSFHLLTGGLRLKALSQTSSQSRFIVYETGKFLNHAEAAGESCTIGPNILSKEEMFHTQLHGEPYSNQTKGKQQNSVISTKKGGLT